MHEGRPARHAQRHRHKVAAQITANVKRLIVTVTGTLVQHTFALQPFVILSCTWEEAEALFEDMVAVTSASARTTKQGHA